jgi:hypothetical protein
MDAGDPAHAPRLVPLELPRPLTVAERALLDALVQPLGVPELVEQVRLSEVISECSCPCPSIGLRTRAPAISAAAVARVTALERDTVEVRDDGYMSIVAHATVSGRQLELTLHMFAGGPGELEIWCSDADVIVETVPPPDAITR